jgi:hypothetical protein
MAVNHQLVGTDLVRETSSQEPVHLAQQRPGGTDFPLQVAQEVRGAESMPGQFLER